MKDDLWNILRGFPTMVNINLLKVLILIKFFYVSISLKIDCSFYWGNYYNTVSKMFYESKPCNASLVYSILTYS